MPCPADPGPLVHELVLRTGDYPTHASLLADAARLLGLEHEHEHLRAACARPSCAVDEVATLLAAAVRRVADADHVRLVWPDAGSLAWVEPDLHRAVLVVLDRLGQLLADPGTGPVVHLSTELGWRVPPPTDPPTDPPPDPPADLPTGPPRD